MRRFLLFSFLFCCMALSASAQQFFAGVKAGASASQISGDQLAGFNKAGIVAGGFVGVSVSLKFDAALEILFFQKGSRKNANPDKEDYTSYLLRLNYFEIPLMLQWKFSKRFTFEAGPSVAFLVGFDEEDEYGQISQPRDFSKLELGLIGGMHVKLTRQFAANVRYENSVLPVREHISGQGYRLNRGQYNTALMLALQYTFGRKTNE